MEQRRLARPRFADNAEHFTRVKIEAYIAAGRDTSEGLGDRVRRENRMFDLHETLLSIQRKDCVTLVYCFSL